MNTPRNPEPKYFLNTELDKKKYLIKYFPEIKSTATWIGDKSTSYFEKREYLERMRQMFPNGKAIAILRHPVHRAISNYKFSVQNGLESRTPEEVFVLNKPKPILTKTLSTDPFDYIEKSKYSTFIPFINQIFQKDVLYVFIDNIINEFEQTKIAQFLDIENLFKIPKEKINVSTQEILMSPLVLEYLSNTLKDEIAFYESLRT